MRVPLLALLMLTLASSQQNKDGDEGRPYEFGFTIDGQQHRHEKKDSNGIIQGEFGFITADGVYHVTVYATDENGNFKILSMKNIRISAPLDGSPATGPISPEAGKYLGKQNQAAHPTQSPQQFQKLQQPPAVPTPKAVTPFQGFTTQPTIRPACAGCGYVKPVTGQPFGLQVTVPPQGPQVVGTQIANRFGQGESLDLIRPPDAEITPQVPGSTRGQSIPNTQNVGGPALPNANVQVQIQGQPNVQLQQNQPPQLQSQQPNAQYQQNLPAGPNQVLNIQQNLPVSPNQVSNVQNSVQYTAGVNQGGIQLPNGQNPNLPTPNIGGGNQGLNLPGQNSGFVESVNGNRGIDPSIQSEQISALPPISVKENVIHVGGANPQDIAIKDKYPGMVNGLPEGIEEKDITNILYKFKYTVGFHGHWERGLKNGAKIGGYFVNGRDGISRIVTYIADENGYRPKFKLVNLGLDSDETPKEGSEKKFGLKDFEFVWYPVE